MCGSCNSILEQHATRGKKMNWSKSYAAYSWMLSAISLFLFSYANDWAENAILEGLCLENTIMKIFDGVRAAEKVQGRGAVARFLKMFLPGLDWGRRMCRRGETLFKTNLSTAEFLLRLAFFRTFQKQKGTLGAWSFSTCLFSISFISFIFMFSLLYIIFFFEIGPLLKHYIYIHITTRKKIKPKKQQNWGKPGNYAKNQQKTNKLREHWGASFALNL